MAGEGEQRCHGTCQVGPRAVGGAQQAWDAVARPQTNCQSSQVHPHRFGPTPEEHAAKMLQELSQFEALLLTTDPTTHQPDLKSQPFVNDASFRDAYREIATPFEKDISRFFVLFGSRRISGKDSAGKSFERILSGPATPVIRDDGVVVGYARFQREGGDHWFYSLDVDGAIRNVKHMGEDPLDDSIGNEVVAIVATAGLGAAAKVLSRLSSAVVAAGGIRLVLTRLGAAVAECAVLIARGIGRGIVRRLSRKVGGVVVGRLLTSAEQAAFAELRAAALALVKQLQSIGKAVRVNIGGTGEVADAINVNPNEVAPRSDIPNLIKTKGERIGELFEAGTVDEVVGNRLAPNGVIEWDKVIEGAHKVLKPGGRISCNLQSVGTGEDAQVYMAALTRLGFKNVKNLGGAGFVGFK